MRIGTVLSTYLGLAQAVSPPEVRAGPAGPRASTPSDSKRALSLWLPKYLELWPSILPIGWLLIALQDSKKRRDLAAGFQAA